MILFIVTAGAVFALCQFLREKALKAAMPIELPGVRLQRTVNRAGAGGLLKNHPRLVSLFAGLAMLLTLIMAIWGSRSKQLGKGALWGLGLVAGGGASNLFERLRHGGVLDYIRFPRLPGRLGKLVFNPADFGIFAGVVAVIWKELGK
jgi:signal peptidase II